MTEWTDDMRVRVDPDRTIDELVDCVLDARREGTPSARLLGELSSEFALSYADARLAIDRVLGGVTRAATESPSNEPSATRDPVAHRAYWRARGAPQEERPSRDTLVWTELVRLLAEGAVDEALLHVGAGFEQVASAAERDATDAWRNAMEAANLGTRPLGSIEATCRLVELAERTQATGVPSSRKHNVLLQLGTALSASCGVIAEELGQRSRADAGSAEWIDAIRIANGARKLADGFEALGDVESTARALEVRRRITTRALGQCYERVGPVMIDCARIELRLGESERAIGLSDAVIADFTRLLEELERSTVPPYEEDVIALNALAEAIALRTAAGGTSVHDALERRVRALLVRTA